MIQHSDALLRLVEREGGVCHLCQGIVDMYVEPNHPAFPSRDHVIPRRVKGKGVPGVLKLAHSFCNSHRGHRKLGKCKARIFKERLAKAVEEYEAKKYLVDGKYSVG